MNVPIELDGVDLTTEVVRTARLVLRPPRQDDVDDVLRAGQDPESQRWLPMPVPYTRDDAVAFVAQRIEERAEGRGLLCAVEADGRLVGSAGLHLSPSLLGPGVGYSIAPWARGRGYAAEAAAALAAWAIAHGAHRVHLLADIANIPSQVVARRAGFVEEGRLRACLPYRDRPHGDAVLFSRLPRDPPPGQLLAPPGAHPHHGSWPST
jgi:RimJ/RimL family protein N-acetyltransferase